MRTFLFFLCASSSSSSCSATDDEEGEKEGDKGDKIERFLFEIDVEIDVTVVVVVVIVVVDVGVLAAVAAVETVFDWATDFVDCVGVVAFVGPFVVVDDVDVVVSVVVVPVIVDDVFGDGAEVLVGSVGVGVVDVVVSCVLLEICMSVTRVCGE